MTECRTCGEEKEKGQRVGSLFYCNDCMSSVSDGYMKGEIRAEKGEQFGYE